MRPQDVPPEITRLLVADFAYMQATLHLEGCGDHSFDCEAMAMAERDQALAALDDALWDAHQAGVPFLRIVEAMRQPESAVRRWLSMLHQQRS